MPVEPNIPPPFHQNGHVNGHANGYTNGHANGHVSSHVNGYVPPPLSPSALPPSEELGLGDIIAIARRRRWVSAGVAIATIAMTWGWTLTRIPIYRGEFRVLVEPVAEDDRSQELLQGTPEKLSRFDYETQVEVLRSPALLEPIAEKLEATYPEISPAELLSKLSINRLRDTKVLTVSYLDTDPQRIQTILAEVSQHYLDYSFEQRQSSLQQGIQFVEEQLPELRSRVNSLQTNLEHFRQEYSLLDPQLRGDDLSELLSSVEEQQQVTQTQLAEAQSLYTNLRNQLGYNPAAALAASALSESPRYQALLDQVRQVEVEIATTSVLFLPDSPDVQVLQERRSSLLPLLNAEAGRLLSGNAARGANDSLTATALDLNRQLLDTANQVEVLAARRDALATVEEGLKQEFSLVPALAKDYTDLQRELTIATASLDRFLTTRETLQIESAQKSIPWELISNPTVVQSPISPNIPRNLLLGAIAGLGLGSAAALLADKVDTAIRSCEELKALTQLPILSVVPHTKNLGAGTKPLPIPTLPSSRGIDQNYLAAETPIASPSTYHASPFLEAFRTLYTNLRFLSSDTPIRSIVVTSSTPGDGKSVTALHLAKAAAAMGQRVLLVDADLRCPQIHNRLNIHNLRGLSNLIASDLPLSQLLQHPPQDAADPGQWEHNLFVLTAGSIPPDPVKLLASRKMQTLMKRSQEHFDLVIYDTPPAVGFADSSLLASYTDGIVLVAGLGKTDRAMFLQALETLRMAPVQLLGIVANGVKTQVGANYRYGYHRYYQSQSASRDRP